MPCVVYTDSEARPRRRSRSWSRQSRGNSRGSGDKVVDGDSVSLAPKRDCKNLFTGDLYRGREHMMHMRAAKRAKEDRAKFELAQDSVSALASGDKVVDELEDSHDKAVNAQGKQ